MHQDNRVGIVIVDHGSRRDESNEKLLDMVALFQRQVGYTNVEAAHMEIAEPSIATAFRRCVAAGAELVVVCPFILLPGRHWKQDIPQLTAAAAEQHPGVRYVVAAPLGVHPLLAELLSTRLRECLDRVASSTGENRQTT